MRSEEPSTFASPDVDLLRHGTLPAAWERRWSRGADPYVLHFAETGWIGSNQLNEDVMAVAGGLAAAAPPGERVLVSGPPSYEFVVHYLATLRAALICVPINPGYTRREVEHVIRDADPRVVVSDNENIHEWARESGRPDQLRSMRLQTQHLTQTVPSVSPETGALLVYTSGTTGTPKGALLSHTNLLASAASIGLAWHWSAVDQLLVPLPLFHVHGLCNGINGTLLNGGGAVVLPRFDPDLVLDAIETMDVTMLFGVPTMYHRLAKAQRRSVLSRLRLCVSGSAPLPAGLHREIATECGQQVLERYGTTETLMNTSNPYDGERRPGTVGMPLPGVELRLERGSGEIQVRGPNVFGGYWRRRDLMHDTFDDGWFRTGDIGEYDDDGYIRIRGRSKELIITGGLNVYPKEVEEVLLGHPGVSEVAVVGTPSDEWGELVTAFVVSADRPLDQSVLDGVARANLAAHKVPRAYRFVDALPRNALGKVLRSKLTEP